MKLKHHNYENCHSFFHTHTSAAWSINRYHKWHQFHIGNQTVFCCIYNYTYTYVYARNVLTYRFSMYFECVIRKIEHFVHIHWNECMWNDRNITGNCSINVSLNELLRDHHRQLFLLIFFLFDIIVFYRRKPMYRFFRFLLHYSITTMKLFLMYGFTETESKNIMD